MCPMRLDKVKKEKLTCSNEISLCNESLCCGFRTSEAIGAILEVYSM